MQLTEDHLRASYEIYMNYGNSSSATIMAVMNRLRGIEGGKENVIACAFGPGISLEMMVLRKFTNKSTHDKLNNNGSTTKTLSNQDNGQASANGHGNTLDREATNGHVVGNGTEFKVGEVMVDSLPVPDID